MQYVILPDDDVMDANLAEQCCYASSQGLVFEDYAFS